MFTSEGVLQPGIMVFRTHAGAEECVCEWTPEGFRAEIMEVELGD